MTLKFLKQLCQEYSIETVEFRQNKVHYISTLRIQQTIRFQRSVHWASQRSSFRHLQKQNQNIRKQLFPSTSHGLLLNQKPDWLYQRWLCKQQTVTVEGMIVPQQRPGKEVQDLIWQLFRNIKFPRETISRQAAVYYLYLLHNTTLATGA